MADPNEYPMVDGAPLNPYDLPGQPRPDDDVAETEHEPTAEESAPVPGPGDPDVELVELGESIDPTEPTAGDKANDEDDEDDKPTRRRKG